MANHIEYKIKSFKEDTKTVRLNISNSNAMYNIHR